MPDEPLTAEHLAAIRQRAESATEGPWWFDEDELCWRLHGVHAILAAFGPVPEQVMNHQILKAQKKNTTMAEYWPNAADAEFIAHARQDVPDLLAEIARLTALITAPDAVPAAPVPAPADARQLEMLADCTLCSATSGTGCVDKQGRLRAAPHTARIRAVRQCTSRLASRDGITLHPCVGTAGHDGEHWSRYGLRGWTDEQQYDPAAPVVAEATQAEPFTPEAVAIQLGNDGWYYATCAFDGWRSPQCLRQPEARAERDRHIAAHAAPAAVPAAADGPVA